MSEEDRMELKKELSVYSKEELLEKYIDELEENNIITDQWYKSSQRVDKAIEYMKYNATSNYFDKEKNMFRREIDLLDILKGNDK